MLKSRKRSRVSMAAALVVLIASGAFAADRERNPRLPGEEKIEGDLRKSQFRAGSFFILTGFRVGDISIEEDLYLPAEGSQDELSLRVSLPTRFFYAPHRKFIVSADVEPQFALFLKEWDASDFHWRTRLDTHFLYNRLYADFYAETSDLLTRQNSELRVLVQQDEIAYGADTELMFSSRTAGELDVRFQNRDYPTGLSSDRIDLLTSRLEREERSWTAKIRHQTFPITTVSIGTTQIEHDFDVFPERNASTSEYFVGFDRDRRKTKINVQIGHSKLDYDDASRKDFSGLIGSGSWSISPRRRWTLSLGARRRLEFSTFEDNDHFQSDRFEVTNRLQITERLSGFVTLETGQNKYFLETDLTPAFEPEKRVDDLYFFAVGADLRVIGRLGVGATLASWKRDSNVAGLDDDGIRLMFRLSLGPNS